ncbi:hypothetical protein ACQQ2Q_17945 [Agrobacterium sp. ES01]|uniref:hypothetical protein n=1 Tax=Agrobacterium sp. ES01 TaxID=3420714 RepID=UPI003D0E8ED8
MNDVEQTNRMQFLTFLDRYLGSGHTAAERINDRIVSVKILCSHLWDDDTGYVRQFSSHMRDVCGHEFEAWERLGGTWGAAARAAAYHIDHSVMGQHGRPVRPQGMWVAKALRITRPSAQWSVEIPGRSSADAE